MLVRADVTLSETAPDTAQGCTPWPVCPAEYEGDLWDTEVTIPGPQYDCTVLNINDMPGTTESMWECNNLNPPTNLPCWRIVADPTACSAASHLALQIVGGGTAPAAETLQAYCQAMCMFDRQFGDCAEPKPQ
jgi:hypothetical protein